jgi:hypothetical protein
MTIRLRMTPPSGGVADTATLGADRFRAIAARRGVRVSRTVAGRLVDAARAALPTARGGRGPSCAGPPTLALLPDIEYAGADQRRGLGSRDGRS